MNIISYALFGYNQKNEGFDFNTYLRGFMINVRLARLIYPDFQIRLHLDKNTYTAFKSLFDSLPIQLEILNEEPLCKAMLWRMKPLFDENVEVVLCRDLDSPITYREAQAVKYWMNKDKAAHAITDSVSHDVPMLGGMIGFKRRYFKDYTGFSSWDEMVNGSGLDYSKKGTDQTMLTNKVYPCFAKHGRDSITQHYVLGMPNSFLSDCHNKIQDMELSIPYDYKESNDICGHIGAAGYYEGALLKFLHKHVDKFNDLRDAESAFSDIFFWVKEKTF